MVRLTRMEDPSIRSVKNDYALGAKIGDRYIGPNDVVPFFKSYHRNLVRNYHGALKPDEAWWVSRRTAKRHLYHVRKT